MMVDQSGEQFSPNADGSPDVELSEEQLVELLKNAD